MLLGDVENLCPVMQFELSCSNSFKFCRSVMLSGFVVVGIVGETASNSKSLDELVAVAVEVVAVEVVGVVLESVTEELTVAESLSCTRGFLINLSAWERFSEIRR